MECYFKFLCTEYILNSCHYIIKIQKKITVFTYDNYCVYIFH